MEKILSRLEKVKTMGRGRYLACCPAHDDRSPSLSIAQCDDGKILIHCFAGCPVGDVLEAIGLRMSDLFPDGIRGNYKSGPIPHWKLERLRATADHERAVLACMQADMASGLPIDVERAAKAKDRLRKIGRLLDE